MDARSCLRSATLALVVLPIVVIAVGCGARAEADTDVLAGVDAGFEGSLDGWVASGATLASANVAPAPRGGVAAGRVTSTGTAAVVLSSQVWRVPTEPAAHTLALWLYDNDSRITLTVELSFHDGGYQAIGAPTSAMMNGDATAWRLVTLGPVTAPAATTFAKVSVRGTPSAAGATFWVDDATLARAEVTPTPTPSPTPTSTPGPAATTTPTPTPSPTPAPVATSIPTANAAPTPVPTAPVPAVFAILQNGDFERAGGLFGWTATGGIAAQVMPGLGGSAYAAMLTSGTTSTKFLQQAVTVSPLSWYAGSVRLKLTGEAEAAWLRIAWYASPDAEGAQLATVDSALVVVREAVLGAETGPVRAPAEARSARVRIMLRPVGSGPAQVTADDVRFGATAAPTPTPAPTSTSTPVATATPLPTTPVPTPPVPTPAPPIPSPLAASLATPVVQVPPAALPGSVAVGAVAAAAAPAPRTAASAAGTAMLRIVELLPDPMEPGADADFEWVELANLGREPAALGGLLLGDNQGTVALPDVTLEAGMVLVIAGRRAAVPEASAYRPAQGFSNGLGNGGDRLALFLPDRTVIDALSYGSDTTYDHPPLPAPGPGASLLRRFADDGSYAGFEVMGKPSPGVLDVRRSVPSPAVAPGAIVGGADPLAWGALVLVGAGALAAAAVQRYRAARGERG